MLRRRLLPLLLVAGLLLGASASALAGEEPPPDVTPVPNATGIIVEEPAIPPQDIPFATGQAEATPPPGALPETTYKYYLPFVTYSQAPCQATGQSYGSIAPYPPPTDRPAAEHGDINLGLPGYGPISAYLGLVDYGGPTDDKAPQLYSLFLDNRTATFVQAYQINHWVWDGDPPIPGHRGDPITDPNVTLIDMAMSPGEKIRAPASGYTIGEGKEVMVLYATANRIVLKYTREDNIVFGYALYVENFCVDPNLLALYNQLNSQGRSRLPALTEGQPFGRAMGTSVGVAIRDTGHFFDPRSRKDWWKGR
jgi:hypothetical protein